MQISEIENYVDDVLRAALSKCGDLHDAEDLAQEILTAAVLYLSSGKDIDKPKSWLYAVMNHKYHDMLRRKYNLPVVIGGEDFDIADESDPYELVGKSDTDMGEALRRAAVLGR